MIVGILVPDAVRQNVTREVLIGVTLPLSGSLSIQGNEVRRGLELWRREAGARQRRGIKIAVLDDGSSARQAAANAETLLEQGVDLLFGPYGGAAGRAVAELAQPWEVLMWNHSSSDDDVARPYVVTLPTPASRYLVAAVELAAEQGCSDALIAASNTRFGRTVAGGAERCATSLGMRASVLQVSSGQWRSRRSEIISHITTGTVVALCGALRDDIEMVAELQSQGQNVGVIAAVGAGVEEFGRILGSRAQGVIGPSQWESDRASVDIGPKSERMTTAYCDLYGSAPDYLAIQGWAGGVLAEAAVDQVGTEPEDLWKWALRFTGRTAYGDFRLDSEGRQVGHQLRLVRWDAKGNRTLVS